MNTQKLWIRSLMKQHPDSKKSVLFNRIIVEYNTDKQIPCVAVWIGRMPKPFYHYKFESEVHRKAFIEKHKGIAADEQKRDQERKAKAVKEAAKLQPGTILYSSWGYEQTNIDFYIILERKPKSVVIQEIGQHREMDGQDSGICAPDPETKVGEPFLKKINKSGSITLNSYSGCWIWDGSPKRWSSYY